MSLCFRSRLHCHQPPSYRDTFHFLELEADRTLDGVSLYVNFLLWPVFSVTFAVDGDTRVILLTPFVTANAGTMETGIIAAATDKDIAAVANRFKICFSSYASLL